MPTEQPTASELASGLLGLVSSAASAERFEVHQSDGSYVSVTFDQEAISHLLSVAQALPHVAAKFDAAVAQHEARRAERDALNV